MGVVNVTPDSFSDGGLYLNPKKAVAHATQLLAEGADLLDIGGESTRPGSDPVPPGEQIERILPVIEAIRSASDAPLSVDTTRAEVAEAALLAGADMVNDISSFRESPDMPALVARNQGGLILMHMRGTPKTMQADTHYEDVVQEVSTFLGERAALALSAGIPKTHIWIDPGIGFGKSAEGNLEILRRLGELDRLGHPVVAGASRKSFIGKILGREVDQRLAGNLAVTAFVAMGGRRRVHRVHDVREAVDCIRMIQILSGGPA